MLNDLNKLLVMKQIDHPNLRKRMDLLNQNENLEHYLGISSQNTPDVLTDAHFDSEVDVLYAILTLCLVLHACKDLLDEVENSRAEVGLHWVYQYFERDHERYIVMK